jgi:hypothetical protein
MNPEEKDATAETREESAVGAIEGAEGVSADAAFGSPDRNTFDRETIGAEAGAASGTVTGAKTGAPSDSEESLTASSLGEEAISQSDRLRRDAPARGTDLT